MWRIRVARHVATLYNRHSGRSTLDFPILRELARELAPLLAPLVAEQLRGAPVADGWVSQKGSKLGRNNHMAEVRRLQAEGDGERSAIRGRSYLLRKDAYDQALVMSGRKPAPPVKAKAATMAEPANDGDDLEAFFRGRLGVK
jgi:hypothetical protein